MKEYDTRLGETWSFGNVFTNYVVNHDFIEMPNGNILALTFENRKYQDSYYEGDRIIEINRTTNEVTWNWSVWDHFDPSNNCSECINYISFRGSLDWTHMNALSFNKSENTIITSIRNLNTIMKINHTLPGNDKNSVIWELGGKNSDFTGTGNNFSHIHGLEIINGNQIIIFDNGLHRDWGMEPFSRVLVIEINETSMDAEIVWNYNETPAFYSSIWGYAEQLPNKNILITDGFNGRVIEVNYSTQQIVWKMQLPPGYGIYRAYRIQEPFNFEGSSEIGNPLVLYNLNSEIPILSNFEILLIILYSVNLGILIIINYNIQKILKNKKNFQKQ